MCVYMHNKYTPYTHIYYVNKNVYFACDESFGRTTFCLFQSALDTFVFMAAMLMDEQRL